MLAFGRHVMHAMMGARVMIIIIRCSAKAHVGSVPGCELAKQAVIGSVSACTHDHMCQAAAMSSNSSSTNWEWCHVTNDHGMTVMQPQDAFSLGPRVVTV